MLPNLVGQKFELLVIRPVVKAIVGNIPFAMYLLQKNDIGIDLS